jgi:hypothetical protein
MKKNFFKKLSFVLALAMIIATIAPAAGAFAATALHLNSTKKYLHLSPETGYNEFDFNISHASRGSKAAWSSSNEDVAVVDETTGVTTATGVGTATISVDVTAKDGTVTPLTADVVVRDNISTVKVSNAPDKALAVNQAYDLNRSFVTVSGSTTKTSSVTRWTVDKADTASVDNSGVFTATAPGDYKVTALAFQSTANYDEWKISKAAGLVLASAEVTVKVAAGITAVTQVNLVTFKISFDSVMADVAKNLTVFQVIGTTNVNELVKEVKMSADNKSAEVTLFVPFTEKSTYIVKYTGMSEAKFVAATTEVKDVKSLQVKTTAAEISVGKDLEVALLNANGVDIADADLLARVEWKSSNNATYLSGKNLTMFKVGDTTTVTATFHTYDYDGTTGAEVGALTASGVVTCTDQATSSTGLLNAYTLVATGNANFWDCKHTVAAGDGSLQLYVQLKGKEANGWEDKFTDNTAGGHFEFTSSNPDVLIVSETTGAAYPAKEGTAVVVVKYNDVVVGAASIIVTGARKVATVTLDAQSFTLSNDSQVQDVKSVGITVKDQLGADFASYTVDVTVNGRNGVDGGLLTSGLHGSPVRFNGAPAGVPVTKGTYSYTVKITDTTTWASFVKIITVNVVEPSDSAAPATPYYYALESDKSAYDMTVKSDDTSEDVTLSLYGYATNGVRTLRVNIAAGPFTVTVTGPDNTSYTIANAGITAVNTNDAELALITVAGGIVDKEKTGTYLVRATNASGTAVNATYFTVTDNQSKPTVIVNKFYSTETTVLAAINDCFDFSVNGSKIDVASISLVLADGFVAGDNGKTVFVKKVTILETIGGVTISHEVAVNQTINYAR